MSERHGEKHTLPQENGPDVELVVFGDENYSRYETPDGYTAIRDRDLGLFCYATVARGEFISTRVPVSAKPPTGLRRHLHESRQVVRAKTRRKANARAVPAERLMTEGHDTALTFGPNQGLLAGRRVSMGNVRGLTILVNFQDLSSTVTAAQVSALLND